MRRGARGCTHPALHQNEAPPTTRREELLGPPVMPGPRTRPGRARVSPSVQWSLSPIPPVAWPKGWMGERTGLDSCPEGGRNER